ncbi:MAG: hypothetical protein D6715_08815 [Calditrichaeota bacterium]|nr:MAG: hypothetical protein D6715_08815 [Calditrichota bacterium]
MSARRIIKRLFGPAFLLLMGLWMATLACSEERPPMGEVLARVGEQYLLRSAVASQVPADLKPEARAILAREIVENWVNQQVLAQMARKEGLQLTDAEQWQIDALRASLLAQQLIRKKLPADELVSEQEIQSYYQAHQEEFRREFDEVHLVHLYLEKVDRAIQKEIRAASSLLEVIQKNFLDKQVTPILEPNGDLGYVVFDNLRPEFKRALRFRRLGRIYGPIKTRDGYHYLQLLDSQPAGSVRELALVKEEIRQRLKMMKYENHLRDLIAQAKKQIPVETFLQNIH